MKPIKEVKAIRILAKPYMDWRRKKTHDLYLRSPDHFYLRTLKDIHRGKRCFIIGNGPSLRTADLDMLHEEYTFAANRIFNIFNQTNWRPTYYLSVDDRVLKEVQKDLLNYDLGHMFLKYGLCKIKAPTNKLSRVYDFSLLLDVDQNHNNLISAYISEDVSDHVCDSGTVTFDAIQIAIYMGFREIYLLGVDNNYSRTVDAYGKVHDDPSVQDYFDNKKYINMYPAAIANTQYGYTIAKEYCDTHGIKIRNATRGGKLEVFERVDFDELFD